MTTKRAKKAKGFSRSIFFKADKQRVWDCTYAAARAIGHPASDCIIFADRAVADLSDAFADRTP